MKSQLKGYDLILAGLATILFLLVTIVGQLWGSPRQILSIAFILFFALLFQLELFRRVQSLFFTTLKRLEQIHKAQEENYYQTEALLSLYSVIDFQAALPPMRGWAISPDFALVLINLIEESPPHLILEAGSGVSTLIAAYKLKQIGQGHIISLEHEKQFAAATNQMLTRHKLQDIATVIHAPLEEKTLKRGSWLWFDTNELPLDQKFDMLIVDSPPNKIQPESRYPALPLLFEHLSEDAVIILDDGYRESEQKIADRWMSEFVGLHSRMIKAEKGIIIFSINRNRLGL